LLVKTVLCKLVEHLSCNQKYSQPPLKEAESKKRISLFSSAIEKGNDLTLPQHYYIGWYW